MNGEGRGRGRVGLSLLFAALLCLFVALSIWQVERRAWKHALIERVGQRVHAPSVEAPGPGRWAAISAEDDAYRRVRASGKFIAGRETFVQASTALGSGYWMLVPLRRDDGTVLLVNRGFVSGDDRARVVEAAAKEHAPTAVTGLLRLSEPPGRFLFRNDPVADRWRSRDIEGIAAARGLQRVAPYFIDADAGDAEDRGPRMRPVGGLTVVAFSDNHLLYAIVWSALALLCVAALVRLLRMPDAGPKEPEAAP